MLLSLRSLWEGPQFTLPPSVTGGGSTAQGIGSWREQASVIDDRTRAAQAASALPALVNSALLGMAIAASARPAAVSVDLLSAAVIGARTQAEVWRG